MAAGFELVERERELRLADALLERAGDGAGGALLIRGTAGIGKTALLGAIAGSGAARGFRLLRARGGELERDVPFAVARELFEPVVADGLASGRADAARLALPALGLGQDSGALSDTLSAEARFAAVYGLYWLAVGLARSSPLLIVVDDAHLADEVSLGWLAYLVERLDELPIAVLLATRQLDAVTAGPALQSLVDATSASAIAPAPLSAAAVGRLVRARDEATPVDERFVASIHAATGGVPFLVNAVVAALPEVRALAGPDRAPTPAELAAAIEGPELLARLARVAPDALAAAEAIAVLGRGAEPQRVGALAGLAAERVARVGDALTAAGFLAAGSPLQFAHALIAESVYRAIPEGRRSELHARASDLLADALEAGDQAAAHLLAARPAGDELRAERLVAAARRALASGAPSVAITLLRRALREPPPRAALSDTLLALGRAEAQCADPAAFEHLAQAAEAAPGALQRAAAERELSLTLLAGGRLSEVIGASSVALATVGDLDRELALELRAEMLAVAQLDLLGRVEFDALAAQAGEPPAGATPGERRLLGALAFDAMRSCEPVQRTVDLATRALAGWGPHGYGELASPALFLARLALLDAGELDLVRPMLERAVAWTVEHGSPVLYAQNIMLHGYAALLAGKLAATEEMTFGAIEAARETLGAPWVASIIVPHGVVAQVALGALDRARALLSEFGLMEAPAEQVPMSLGLASRGALRLAEGDPAGGLTDLLAGGARLVATGSTNPATMPWRSLAAQAHDQLGDRAAALALAGEDLALSRRFGAPGPLGIALRTHGQLTGGAEGLAELQEAVALLGRSPLRLEHAHALVELGAALRRAGQRRQAREHLAAGLELAARSDARPLVARAEDELRATGARPVRRPHSGIDALTPSERRVAALAATGRTNVEIAQSLFLSLKTVEMHLGRTYRKLGIANRRGLAGRL